MDNMEIKRIDGYSDKRFGEQALYQHGCFLADNVPCEVEIISDWEAVIRGENRAAYEAVIEEFRFYAPHITKFYDAAGKMLQAYPRVQLLTIPLEEIQPTQFFVDEEKLGAVAAFLNKPEDVIIQVHADCGRFLSLDGHTRLYYAVTKGWDHVRGILQQADDYVYRFAEEAKRRGINTPKDMQLVSHSKYVEAWYGFCDALFAEEKHAGD